MAVIAPGSITRAFLATDFWEAAEMRQHAIEFTRGIITGVIIAAGIAIGLVAGGAAHADIGDAARSVTGQSFTRN